MKLMEKFDQKGMLLGIEILKTLMQTNEKQRFEALRNKQRDLIEKISLLNEDLGREINIVSVGDKILFDAERNVSRTAVAVGGKGVAEASLGVVIAYIKRSYAFNSKGGVVFHIINGIVVF